MVFSSAIFLFAFFPFYLLAVSCVRNIRVSNAILLVMSLLFYAWGEPVYLLLMLASMGVNYLLALPAETCREDDRIKRHAMVSLIVVFNLTLLGVFKYAGFAVASLNALLGTGLPVPEIPLPVGISFFTFQTMSYGIDVYRGTCDVQRQPVKFMLYVSFFPQLIAGPIVKYHDIEAQLSRRSTDAGEIAEGIRRFIIGLSKKLLLANVFGQTADRIYSLDSGDLNILLAWAAAITYCLQIYFDFSGYSDMAIGLGRMAGFTFMENFNYPYIAGSLRDFWKRWHISLTTWFREYVYFPLGGNRKGSLRTGVNRMTVFLLTGLWHGAMWTFVLWGAFHGVFQLLETYAVHPQRWKRRFLAHIYTLAVVAAGFVIFRAEGVGQAGVMIGNLLIGFRFTETGLAEIMALCTPFHLLMLAVGITACTPLLSDTAGRLAVKWGNRQAMTGVKYAASLVLLALCVMSLAASTYNPFIYFRF
ncbi:MAG: MBOAT family protein [Clostridia bacterium]|nr:MBOAT family protein [Clostridia bacterium]